MKTDNIKNYSPNFGMVKFYRNSQASEALQEAILNSNVIKQFGKRYNATVEIQYFLSKHDPKNFNLGILLEDIEPANIFIKFMNLFRGKSHAHHISYNVRKSNETEFVGRIKKLDKDLFVNLYHRTFS